MEKNPNAPDTSKPGDGLRSLKTSGVFRALNFELYVKPNNVVMALGLIAIGGCLGYMAYMRHTYEKMGLYVAVQEDGSQALKAKKSRWD